MKKKNITTVTKQNLPMIYGKLKKFFESIKIVGAKDYSTDKWNSEEAEFYKHYFCNAEFKLEDNKIIFELPIRTEFTIGDRIYMDGNKVVVQERMRQYDNSIYCRYQVYKRITKHCYDYCEV